MHVFLVGVCQQKGYPPNSVDIFTTMMINLKLETSLQSHRIPRSIEFPHGWTCILTPTIKSGDEGKRENLLKGRSNPTISHNFFSMVGNGDRWGFNEQWEHLGFTRTETGEFHHCTMFPKRPWTDRFWMPHFDPIRSAQCQKWQVDKTEWSHRDRDLTNSAVLSEMRQIKDFLVYSQQPANMRIDNWIIRH
jgi:hypothetical protein